MKKRRRKQKRKVIGVHVFLVVSFAVLIAGSCILFPKISQRVIAESGYYVPIPITPNPSSGTMQFQTIQFKFIAFTPTPGQGESDNGSSGNTKADKLAALATSMDNKIRSQCGGFANWSKRGCVDGTGPAVSVARLLLNMSQDYSLQCAGFAQAVALGVGLDIGRGDASIYAGRNIPGFRWIPNSTNATMVAGDIPVWSGFGCQHIAVVTHVYGQTRFQVAEANGFAGIFGPAGSVVFDNYGRTGFCVLRGWQHAL